MFFGHGESRATELRLRRIERKLDLIMKALGIEEGADDSGLPEDVRSLADQGAKIEAIKAHREHFGSTLLEAKLAVEDYLRR